VAIVDLSKNPLTERCFEGLLNLLSTNKRIQRVEVKGLIVKNKFSLNKLKPVMNRIAL